MVRYSMKGTNNMNADDDFQVSCIKMMIAHCDKAAKKAAGLAAAGPSKKNSKSKAKKQRGSGQQKSAIPEVDPLKAFCQHLLLFVFEYGAIKVVFAVCCPGTGN
jgi:hypothetical protein